MTPDQVLELGWQMAVGFFVVGVLWLFISQMLLLTVNWVRRMVG
jgi:hypothetical protein